MAREEDRINTTTIRIALLSALLLFLELALIRWIPGHVRLLSYFSNIVLLASFLGIGLGFLAADRRVHLAPWGPLALLGLVGLVLLGRFEVDPPQAPVLYFRTLPSIPVRAVEPFLLLPLLFAAVAMVMTCPAQELGRALRSAPPLSAYATNLAGSAAGVLLFGLASWRGVQPLWWFAAAGGGLVWAGRAARGWRQVVNPLALLLTVALVVWGSWGSVWSPYYRLHLARYTELLAPTSGYAVAANDIMHQRMTDVSDPTGKPDIPYWFIRSPGPLTRSVLAISYDLPYWFIRSPRSVLVIGAGSGSDVAAALKHGARRVVAVDIDPVIVQMGREHHPNHPYQDPRVVVDFDDGRAFLRRTRERYDLIVYAFVDSLAIHHATSGLRLESYLFTREAFETARAHLTENGMLVAYNFYQRPWIAPRLYNTLAGVFGPSLVYLRDSRWQEHFGLFLAGPRIERIAATGLLPRSMMAPDPGVRQTTDDWPFLYLKEPSLPGHYLHALLLMAGLSVLGVWIGLGAPRAWPGWAARDGLRAGAVMFGLGAGFLLLETRSLTCLSLLFGTTWWVNALAFLGILLVALASVGAARASWEWCRGARAWTGLAAGLAMNLVAPWESIGALPALARYLAACLVVFSPLFFASLIFAREFAESADPSRDLGTNLLGAMAGGFLESTSMLWGFRALVLLAAALYALTFRIRRGGPATPAPADILTADVS